ncbi:MAG: bifunctional tetrahydrofolate synthase/dihydrofolate synthase [Panacagrimonas sp.]|nr:bifunctional tetrahydrofolate synthase/dihydrofolate synthase [Panacagrimonas sp.]
MSGVNVPSANSPLADWLDYQERLHPRNIELGLDRVGQVAMRLDLPDVSIPSLIVAGTNGKGSSATLASLIWREGGYRVGLYTSPHLVRYNERVSIDGVAASDADLVRAFVAIESVRGEVALTYFEYGTLAALWLFRERAVQAQVLEVGLGGRLDAVNLVDGDAALLTSVGLDHLDWLGPDRDSVGREKAHVFRARRPAICADPQPPRSVRAHAREIGAELAVIGEDFSCVRSARGWDWSRGRVMLRDLPMPGLGGSAQLRNAAGVIAAITALQPRVPVAESAIRAALPRLALPGRFERQGRCVYDVAHNAEAAGVLAERLAENARAGRSRHVHLVLGMLSDKPVEAFCGALAPYVRQVYCAGLPPPRGLGPAALGARVRSIGLPVSEFADVEAALAAALAAVEQNDEDEVLVTGSFLTVAAARAHG